MKPIRIMRFNPSFTHIATTKYTKSNLFKKLRKIFARKANMYGLHHLVMNSRMGKKRRSYYHDNRYDDPWSNTEEASVRYQGVPYGNSSYIKRDKDLKDYVDNLENIRWNRKVPTKDTQQNEKPLVIDDKEFKSKVLHKPKGKKKKILINCHYESLDHAIYGLLHDYLKF